VLKARSTKEPEAAWLRRLRLAELPRDVAELLPDIADLQPQNLADLPRALPRIIAALAASPPCGDAGCSSPSYQPIKPSCECAMAHSNCGANVAHEKGLRLQARLRNNNSFGASSSSSSSSSLAYHSKALAVLVAFLRLRTKNTKFSSCAAMLCVCVCVELLPNTFLYAPMCC
jgi:hypothetical protein